MVNSARLEILLRQYHNGIISKPEYNELMGMIKTSHDEAILKGMDKIWAEANDENFHSLAAQEHFYQRLVQHKSFQRKDLSIRLKPIYRYAAAAIVLIALSFSIYFYTFNYSAPGRFHQHDIAPGGNKAMLYLSDGKQIDLQKISSGEVLHQSGITISKTTDGQLIYSMNESARNNQPVLENTIVTPKGGQYQVNLPDGTKVWLNAGSTLSFPLQFSNHARIVSLTGEGYFEVAKKYTSDQKNVRLPFYVSTSNQRVEVLGTHFNIHAYPAETVIKTTLLEGSVRVVTGNGKKERKYYLSPGEMSTSNGSDVKISIADLEETMAWKNGLFIFNGQNLQSIMKEVERWYNVDVVFENESLKKDVFNGSTSRFKNISELLEVLESTGSVHFSIKGRRITVMN